MITSQMSHGQYVAYEESLEVYTHAVKSVPMLSAEEELLLAERFHQQGDKTAAQQLVSAHLRFVMYIARGYNAYGLSQSDLIQEGNIGLIKAVKRYDPKVGVRLISFAAHWIRAEIHEHILRNWRIVRSVTTKAQRKLFFNLRRMKKHLGWMTQEEVTFVASELEVSEHDVREMEKYLSAQDIALDVPLDSEDEDENNYPIHYLEDPDLEPALEIEQQEWEDFKHYHLQQALAELDERSRGILERRWFCEDKATLKQLADDYHISAERIRQIEEVALKKVKTYLSTHFANLSHEASIQA